MKIFIYLSELLSRNIVDSDDRFVGRLFDISMQMNAEVFPRADRLNVKRGYFRKEFAFVSMGEVSELGQEIKLKIPLSQIKFERQLNRGEFSVSRDILDQQVVDTNDRKVVRVNDVHLLTVDNQLYLAHVDVGLRAIVRRLGWGKWIDMVVKIFNSDASYLKEEELISWRNTHVLNIGRTKNVIRSDVARGRLSKIPAAELADIMEDLNAFEKISLFKTFSVDLQRRIFADMAPHEKQEIIDQLEDKEGADLLENIPADEATDLLHQLPKERRMQLLRFMHSKASKQLRKLLGFAKGSAGGLMTTEYLYLGEEALVEDAIQKIKENVDFPGNIIHIYIVNDQYKLLGLTSLRRFINADPKAKLMETCYPNKIFVRTNDGMEEVALLLEKYKFTSIPVLDENDCLQGVITMDDVMEELISLAWKKYRNQI